MGETTGISWTDHTFNPWIGCTKVSAGCKNCYAERENNFRKWNGGTWGKGAPRKLTGQANWRKPLQWDRAAAKEGVRRRVFCASLADVFDAEVDDVWRDDLFFLIDSTPNLDWLLLTKRPEIARQYLAEEAREPRPNVWLGTTVENQAAADDRIPFLLQIPAAVRFLSCEPLLGPVDASLWLRDPLHCCWNCGTEIFRGYGNSYEDERSLLGSCVRCNSSLDGTRKIDWVIAGGESGPGARPAHPDWFRTLRDQCAAAGVAFHFKQFGEWAPLPEPFRYSPAMGSGCNEYNVALNAFARRHGASRLLDDRSEGWDHAMIRDGTGLQHGEIAIGRVGTKRAGRELDGRTWDEFPEETR